MPQPKNTRALFRVYCCRKLETKKEEKLQELHTLICYYRKNAALPEQTEPKYKSMIYETKFVTKLLQLIARETQ